MRSCSTTKLTLLYFLLATKHVNVFLFFFHVRNCLVYKDGKVCISILHAPGSDPNQYENASERWLPVHTVESILVSVISMLASPNDESPANLDAAKELRDTPNIFKRKVRNTVRRAQEDW